jgi:hypothetical protein
MIAFSNEKNKLLAIVIAGNRGQPGNTPLRAKRGNLNLFVGDCSALSGLAITIGLHPPQ